MPAKPKHTRRTPLDGLAGWRASGADGHGAFDVAAAESQVDEAARLPVHMSGAWGQAVTERDLVLTTASLALESTALAMMRTGPHDIRPELLLLVHGEDTTALPRLLAYGRDYLSAKIIRAGWKRWADDALPCAAFDALELLLWNRCRRTLRQREDQVSMHRDRYGKLRRFALDAFRRRYEEGAARFKVARATATRNPADWKVEAHESAPARESQPAKRSRARPPGAAEPCPKRTRDADVTHSPKTCKAAPL